MLYTRNDHHLLFHATSFLSTGNFFFTENNQLPHDIYLYAGQLLNILSLSPRHIHGMPLLVE